MRRDTVKVVQRLWQGSRDDAQRKLAECLAREEAALEGLREAELTIARERENLADLPLGAMDAFAAWLPNAQRALAHARARHAEMATATAEARSVLTAALNKVKMGETLMERCIAEERQEMAKRAQEQLNELIAVTAWKRQHAAEAEHNQA